MPTTKTTINLPTEEIDAVKELAERRHISFTHALRQAIQTELFIQGLIDEGAKLLAQTADGDLERLVFTQAASPPGTRQTAAEASELDAQTAATLARMPGRGKVGGAEEGVAGR